METIARTLFLLSNASWWTAQWLRVQPWREFLDLRQISMPTSAEEVVKRMEKNWERFSRNYGALFLIVFSGFVLWCLGLLFSAFCLFTAAVCKTLKINVETFTRRGRRFNQNMMVALAAGLALYVVYANGASAALCPALAISLAAGAFHAAAFTPPAPRPPPKKVARRLTYD